MFQVYLTIQYIGILILAFEILFMFLQRSSRIQRDMFFMLVCLLIMFVSYTLEMKCTGLEEAMAVIKFGYLGKPFIVFSMLLLLVDYCRIQMPKWLFVLLCLIQTSITVAVFTSDRHTLYYSSIKFVNEGLFPHVQIKYGPLYQFFIVDLVVYCIFMVAFCLYQLQKQQSVQEQRQLLVFSGMIVIAFLFYAIYLLDLFQGYDCTSLGFLIVTLCISFSFLKLNLFDTVMLAKEQAFDYIGCGMVVYDQNNRLLYKNKIAQELGIDDRALSLSLSKAPYFSKGSVYEIEDHPIEKDGLLYGHMLFIQDITDSYNRKEQEEAAAGTVIITPDMKK